MNSISKGHHDNDCDCKKEKKHCPTIIKCGCSSGAISVLPTASTASPTLLATVAVNIPKGCDSCVKIEYASTVTAASSTTIIVTIFKNCPDNFRIPIGSYSYTAPGTPDTNTSTFSFFVCDCDTCCSKEYCYYTAEATSANAVATVAATLAAIVSSSDFNC